jgi:hypothetical protein
VVITDELKAFIMEKIDSLGHLEVLCLLHSNPEAKWTADSVNQKLRSNLALTAAQLAQLKSRGLLKSDENGNYFYSVSELRIDRLVLQVIELYKDRRVTLINFLYNKPTEKVKALADAFKIRKDD